MNCPYCRHPETEIIFQMEMPNLLAACREDMLGHIEVLPFEVRLCPECVLGFNSRPLSDKQLDFIYTNYEYISPLSGIGRTKYEGMIETLLRWVKPRERVLEIGCSEGYLLAELRKRGFGRLEGIEPGPQADTARDTLGLQVTRGFFNEQSYRGESFDAVLLMHVFEHFRDPFSILREIGTRLSKSGKVIIEVPDLTGFHHQHLFFYTRSFFRRLLRDQGLTPLELTAENGILRCVAGRGEAGAVGAGEREEQITYLAQARGMGERFRQKIEHLTGFFRDRAGSPIYWWGAGSLSVITLNALPEAVRKTVQLRIFDGDRKKVKLVMPGTGTLIEAVEALHGKHLDHLVVASSFYKEIRERLEKDGVKIDQVIPVEP